MQINLRLAEKDEGQSEALEVLKINDSPNKRMKNIFEVYMGK